MTCWNVATSCIGLVALCGLSVRAQENFQEPWSFAYSAPGKGSCIGIDGEVSRSGKYSGFLSGTTISQQYGSIGFDQIADAKNFRRKRLRFMGYIKTEQVVGSAFLEVQLNSQGSHALQRCQSPPIDGTNDLQAREIVFDVPPSTDVVVIRCVLIGEGKVWFDDASVGPAKKVRGKLTCVDSLSRRELFGSDTTFATWGKTKFLDLDFELTPSFPLDWHKRRTCPNP